MQAVISLGAVPDLRAISNASSCRNDNTIGPIVHGCRNDSDFTLVFEQSVLAIVPSTLFIIIAIFRIVQLSRKPRLVRGKIWQSVKLLAISVYTLLQLSLLVLTCLRNNSLVRTSIASSALSLASSLFVLALSPLEHARSIKTSALLNVYLALTILCDAVQTRTQWLIDTNEVTWLFLASVVSKIIILLLEAQGKDRWSSQDKRSPEETAGIFNNALLFWINDLIWLGYRKVLRVKDLYPLDDQLAAETHEEAFQKEWSKLPNTKYHLLKTIFRTLSWPLLAPAIPRVVLIGFTFSQPFLIHSLLEYLQEDPSKTSRNQGYGYIAASFFIYFGISIFSAFYGRLNRRANVMVRACLVAAIYRKTTDLSITDAHDSAAITLMSTDIERVQSGFDQLHDYWANAIEVVLAAWLLETQLGLAFLAPIAVVTVCFGLTLSLGSVIGSSLGLWMDLIQKRVSLTTSVISGMTSLKMSGLEEKAEALVAKNRDEEMKATKRYRAFHVASAVIAFTPTIISPLAAFAATSSQLTTTRVFTALAYLSLLSSPLIMIFQTLPQLFASLTCLERVQKYLELKELSEYSAGKEYQTSTSASISSNSPNSTSSTLYADDAVAVKVTDGTFGWAENSVLTNILLAIPKGKLTIVVGPVASGKSTLCKALLRETTLQKGEISFHPEILQRSFCDQSPYLINATIQENIVGPGIFDQPWYTKVISATALNEDLKSFPQGDQSLIGTGGIVLSGGQRHRVALARALYTRPDLIVLDDIFSGLDATTEEHIFQNVFSAQGLLLSRGSTVILATQSVRHLPSADYIVALGKGTIAERGSFEELRTNKGYIQELGVTQGKQASVKTETQDSEIKNPIKKVDAQEEENKARQIGDLTIYGFWYRNVGLTYVLPFVVLASIFAGLYNFPAIWLKYWSSAIEKGEDNTPFYLGIFFVAQISCLITIGSYFLWSLNFIAIKLSYGLHSKALRTLMGASLFFFTSVDIGTTTNRFSQDMSHIDDDLAWALGNLVGTTLVTAAQAGVIATSSPYILFTYPILMGQLYLIQRLYLRTSRQLKFLDLEAKAPLYAHFIETIQGLPTIRAFGWVSSNVETFNSLFNDSQRPMYLLSMIQQWLTLVLNTSAAVLAVIVVTLATQLDGNSGFTGAGLVMIITFGDLLAAIVRNWTQVETATGALSRIKQFTENTPQEVSDESRNVLSDSEWSPRGNIVFDSVSAAYESKDSDDHDKPPTFALKNINLDIRAGENIAICGRTGSGKSSLLMLLLRFIDPSSGQITLDDTPLYQISRQKLRAQIITLPQTPFFLQGSTFRQNLEIQDQELNNADLEQILGTVQLWDAVQTCGGLDAEMKVANLSHGQRQLFSLARALLRAQVRVRQNHSGGILLLDEFTASVDQHTDELMQKIIKDSFEAYTVICIAHRIHTILDYDRVVVMDKGQIVETGKPQQLLEIPDGRLKELWKIGRSEEIIE